MSIERIDRITTRLLVAVLTVAVTFGWSGMLSGRVFSTLEIVGLAFASLMLVLLVFAPWD